MLDVNCDHGFTLHKKKRSKTMRRYIILTINPDDRYMKPYQRARDRRVKIVCSMYSGQAIVYRYRKIENNGDTTRQIIIISYY